MPLHSPTIAHAYASSIATFLGTQLYGSDIVIGGVSAIDSPETGTVVFARKYSPDTVCKLQSSPNVLAILSTEFAGHICDVSYILSDHPRRDFIRVLAHFFEPPAPPPFIHPTTVIAPGACIAQGVHIGAHCYIGAEASIGTGSVVHPRVVIDGRTTIGQQCEIKSGAVIGQSGFGFERNESGLPVPFPHIGGVHIGDHVYIGANTCVDRGTIGQTIIEDHAKIDNLVHVAHNCHVKSSAFVIAGAVLCGGVVVGERAWISPQVAVREHLNIGSDALVGLSALVLTDVADGQIVVGHPAQPLSSEEERR